MRRPSRRRCAPDAPPRRPARRRSYAGLVASSGTPSTPRFLAKVEIPEGVHVVLAVVVDVDAVLHDVHRGEVLEQAVGNLVGGEGPLVVEPALRVGDRHPVDVEPVLRRRAAAGGQRQEDGAVLAGRLLVGEVPVAVGVVASSGWGTRSGPRAADPWMCCGWGWLGTRPREWMTTLRPPSPIAVSVAVPLAPLPFCSTSLAFTVVSAAALGRQAQHGGRGRQDEEGAEGDHRCTASARERCALGGGRVPAADPATDRRSRSTDVEAPAHPWTAPGTPACSVVAARAARCYWPPGRPAAVPGKWSLALGVITTQRTDPTRRPGRTEGSPVRCWCRPQGVHPRLNRVRGGT